MPGIQNTYGLPPGVGGSLAVPWPSTMKSSWSDGHLAHHLGHALGDRLTGADPRALTGRLVAACAEAGSAAIVAAAIATATTAN